MYDLPTHEALATWERKNDLFGWGFLGGETLGMLLVQPRALLLDAFKRVLAERVAAAAGIVEDGSINTARKRNPPIWQDADGADHPVPNLINDHVNALLAALGVATPEDAIAFLRAHGASFPGLHVAFEAPPLPAYYGVGDPPPRGKWTWRSRSIAAMSGTTCRSTAAANRWCSGGITTRTSRSSCAGVGRKFRSVRGVPRSARGAARCMPMGGST